MKTFYCSHCKQTKERPVDEVGTGYAVKLHDRWRLKGWRWDANQQDYSKPIDITYNAEEWDLLEDDGEGEYLYQLFEGETLKAEKKCKREQ
jgi:hypothetical protein